MRTRYRYDAELDCLVEIGGNSNYFEEKTESANVISDDVGAGVNGLRHMPSGKMLDSKSAHRKETKARGLEEVGTQTDFASQKARVHPDDYMRTVIDAQQQIQSNHNSTADWLRRQNEQKPR
jgi:hypothetical protein